MPTATIYPQAAANIVDRAFILCELASPSSLGDDSDPVRDAAVHYPEALRTCLEAHDWSFARRRVRLSQTVPGPDIPADPDLPFIYALPDDMLRLRAVSPGDVIWRIVGASLFADQPGPLLVNYTATIENELTLTAALREAIAAELALRLAPRWLGTASKLEVIEGLAQRALSKAIRDDRQTASPVSWHGGPLTDWGRDIIR
jgi:hypothetical protein